MIVTARRTSALLLALCTLRVATLAGQSTRHDLPLGFRSMAGVVLNRDSAATILAQLGDTRERRVGTGHDASIEWCYAVPGEPTGALLELMSDASTMGTPGHELNVIRLRSDASADDRAGCAPLHTSAALSTPAGLRLGLTQSKIQALLGRPAHRGADSLVYNFDAKRYMQPDTPEYERWNTSEYRESCFDAGPPYANIEATINIVLRDGRAFEIRIERYDRSVC